jgi:hypothetical protein
MWFVIIVSIYLNFAALWKDLNIHVIQWFFSCILTVRHNYVPISRPIRALFPRKCDLNLTRVLRADGNYYFQTYKYLYIYYTTSLSWDSEICFQIKIYGFTACERLTFLSGDLPNVYLASHVIPGTYAAAEAKCSRMQFKCVTRSSKYIYFVCFHEQWLKS